MARQELGTNWGHHGQTGDAMGELGTSGLNSGHQGRTQRIRGELLIIAVPNVVIHQIKKKFKVNIKSKHGRIQYSCDICCYKSRYKGEFKIHINCIHEGICYHFYQCSHTSGRKNYLKHILNQDMRQFIIAVTNTVIYYVEKMT